ncbi:hypothetical protein AMIS_75540 [Actinoplanes missouriensis 431]|uniref:Pyridoxamine 5'-phosphate oxidase putative domain-containing protein n=1 Tax=Actinoplanes missouriensis (strain ATCC 14538 / DSM 43046 / CBS 188.64 / JCM 3121 / NBRC 102363 / NCIMB 12654 / NRRL B-3342 / UNCC 431) TaxID=512565 RepID=I0HID7_ACTM4|nr:hypothetical protein [Actinoplanes missouriensis]BAL92774.1 hypothetical protein AMIS_75540 [Actinoplanes missouriensis 431]
MTTGVLDEAIKKAAIAWISVGDGPAYALWCMPAESSIVVVSGPGEQFAPGLAEAQQATVRLRGDHGGLIVATDATVTRLTPGSDEWNEIAPALAAKRLNASGSADELVARWAKTNCVLVRVTPVPESAVTGPGLPAEAGAEPPRETPARVETKRPFRLHRVRKR